MSVLPTMSLNIFVVGGNGFVGRLLSPLYLFPPSNFMFRFRCLPCCNTAGLESPEYKVSVYIEAQFQLKFELSIIVNRENPLPHRTDTRQIGRVKSNGIEGLRWTQTRTVLFFRPQMPLCILSAHCLKVEIINLLSELENLPQQSLRGSKEYTTVLTVKIL